MLGRNDQNMPIQNYSFQAAILETITE